MIDQLVDALKHVWTDVGLSFKTGEQQFQPEQRLVLRQHA